MIEFKRETVSLTSERHITQNRILRIGQRKTVGGRVARFHNAPRLALARKRKVPVHRQLECFVL